MTKINEYVCLSPLALKTPHLKHVTPIRSKMTLRNLHELQLCAGHHPLLRHLLRAVLRAFADGKTHATRKSSYQF